MYQLVTSKHGIRWDLSDLTRRSFSKRFMSFPGMSMSPWLWVIRILNTNNATLPNLPTRIVWWIIQCCLAVGGPPLVVGYLYNFYILLPFIINMYDWSCAFAGHQKQNSRMTWTTKPSKVDHIQPLLEWDQASSKWGTAKDSGLTHDTEDTSSALYVGEQARWWSTDHYNTTRHNGDQPNSPNLVVGQLVWVPIRRGQSRSDFDFTEFSASDFAHLRWSLSLWASDSAFVHRLFI